MEHESNPTAAILIIGNEILSGRTKDTNINFIANELIELGIDLKEVRVVEDDEHAIVEGVNTLREKFTYVFTTGGIGFTHDDITSACIAKAFGRDTYIDPEIETRIANHYKETLNDSRLSMARVPVGISGLVENPVSHVPSFYIENVFVLAGMPSVMRGMFQSLKPLLKTGKRVKSVGIRSSVLEGMIAVDLQKLQDDFPSVSIGSYPFYEYDDPKNRGTVLVARSRDYDALTLAFHELQNLIIQVGGEPIIEQGIDTP
jgi:molybdenum cofactor synthesis domain-containing protein